MDELRERRRQVPLKEHSMPKASSVIRQLDFFPKVDDDYVIKTNTGGYCGVITLWIMLFLFLSEIVAYCTLNHSEIITVRNSTDNALFIDFNMTFYNISCASSAESSLSALEIVFDLLDEDGVHSYGSSSQLMKMDVDMNGTVVGFNRQSVVSLPSCGSCYGAGSPGQCCDDCESVVRAYRQRGWDPYHILAFSPVCRKAKVRQTYAHRVGCMLWGAVHVNQVAGDVHIAARTGLLDNWGRQVYDQEIIHTLSSSHYIQHFSFGDVIPGVSFPLDGKSFWSPVLSSHVYNIEVLPSTYLKGDVRIDSNEYSIYETDNLVVIGMNSVADYQPGIFFKYSISPFQHVIREERKPFSHLLIRICAVIGGTMSISRLFDSLMYKYRK